MAKTKRTKTAAERTGSPEALACLLRSGGGKHGDRRTKRQRTRATALRAALRD
jgi:hypothetical protein